MLEKNNEILAKIIKYCNKIEEILNEAKYSEEEYINKSIYYKMSSKNVQKVLFNYAQFSLA